MALTCRQTPKSRKMIGNAMDDAAKLFTLELQIDAGRLLPELPDEITNTVMRSEIHAKRAVFTASR